MNTRLNYATSMYTCLCAPSFNLKEMMLWSEIVLTSSTAKSSTYVEEISVITEANMFPEASVGCIG